MLSTIIDHINEQIPAGLVAKKYCLVEQVTDGEKTYPASYIGNGQYKHIDLDKSGGLSYVRKNGDITQSDVEDDSNLIAGKKLIERTTPLKMVIAIPRSKTGGDSPYLQERVADTIISAITENSKALRTEVGAKSITIFVTTHSTNRTEIKDGEYTGAEITDINYNYIYISLDIEIEVLIRAECLTTICD